MEALTDVVALAGGKPVRKTIRAESVLVEEKTIFGAPCLVKSTFGVRFQPGPHGEKRAAEFVVHICSADGSTVFAEGEIHADHDDHPDGDIGAHSGYKIAFANAKKALKFSGAFAEHQAATAKASTTPPKLKR